MVSGSTDIRRHLLLGFTGAFLSSWKALLPVGNNYYLRFGAAGLLRDKFHYSRKRPFPVATRRAQSTSLQFCSCAQSKTQKFSSSLYNMAATNLDEGGGDTDATLDTVLHGVPSGAEQDFNLEEILACLITFVQNRGKTTVSFERDAIEKTDDEVVNHISKVTQVAREVLQEIEATSTKKACRRALLDASLELVQSTSCTTSGPVAAFVLTLSLSLDGDAAVAPVNRAIASAIGAALHQSLQQANSSRSSSSACHYVLASLFHQLAEKARVTNPSDGATTPLDTPADYHIVSGMAKAAQVSCDDDKVMAQDVATVLSHSLGLGQTCEPTTVPTVEDQELRTTAAASLSMAAQLRPWHAVEPKVLVKIAISYSLWHAAEQICTAAIKSQGNASVQAFEAVEVLLEGSFDARCYRQADTWATTFFESGGKRRFLEARYLHACGTISKVIRKGAIQVIDRQVDRVEKAARKMLDCGYKEESDTLGFYVTPLTAQSEIRSFALQQLEQADNVAAAERLARLWGIDYVLDEEALLAAQKERREKYLQWEDVLLGYPADLVSTPEALVSTMQTLREDEGINKNGAFGFDAEWHEDNSGVDLLQIASMKNVVLIDVPALSSTPEGAAALEETVGHLFASPLYTKVGFSCRQDIAKLQVPGKGNKRPWFTNSQRVIDLQTLVSSKDPTLSRYGLSRVCERYLGKPLDKSEQCSFWNARPLSLGQRTYAALDAWTVRAIYQKLSHTDQV